LETEWDGIRQYSTETQPQAVRFNAIRFALLPFQMKRLDQPANYAHQRRMTARDHDPLAELASILAGGLQRLFDRKSSRKLPVVGETPLDCQPPSGGHVRKRTKDMIA
jgi:hypothetical protein